MLTWNIKIRFRNFQPQDWTDYALIPYWLLRYWAAWVWWQIATWVNVLRGIDRRWAMMFGRHDDPAPVMCDRCLWAGPRCWLVHTYRGVGEGDVEAVDECPRCGGEV